MSKFVKFVMDLNFIECINKFLDDKEIIRWEFIPDLKTIGGYNIMLVEYNGK